METTTELDALTATTIDLVRRIDAAINAHDIEAVMASMTDDCVFDNRILPDPAVGTHCRVINAHAAFHMTILVEQRLRIDMHLGSKLILLGAIQAWNSVAKPSRMSSALSPKYGQP